MSQRSNDGGNLHSGFMLPTIRKSLRLKLTNEFVEPIKRKEPRIFNGPKPLKKTTPSSVSDEQVLEVRRLHAWHGMKPRDIKKITGLTSDQVYRYIGYTCRNHLDPGPCPIPSPTLKTED